MQNRYINAGLYEIVKREAANIQRQKFLGKKLTPEHKAKLSQSLLGKTKGIPKSEETKQKMRKPKSEAHRKAISETRKLKYALLRQNNN